MLSFKGQFSTEYNATAINDITDIFDQFHKDVFEDAYNLCIKDINSSEWELTHSGTDELKTMAYRMDGKKLNTSLNTVKEAKKMRKFTVNFKNVKFDKVKNFICDFGKMITSEGMTKSNGIAKHHSD